MEQLGARHRMALERHLASQSFVDFLSYVKLESPPPGGGIIAYEVWPHIHEVATLLTGDQGRRIVWLKARQVGASWLLVAYAVWLCEYRPNATVVLVSQGQLEARELLRRARRIHHHLPVHLQSPLQAENLEIAVWESGARILALPSTEKAGRAFTATLVIMDEADYHEYFEASLAAIKPTVDAGGQIVVVSTSNFTSATSGFKTLFREAPGNGFTPVFFPWSARPGRDDAWYQAKMRESTDRARTEKEYPNTATQALAAAATLAAFPGDILEDMARDARAPIAVMGLANIFQPPIAGKRYAAFTDTAHGVGSDFGVTVIMDMVTGYVVADILSNSVSPDELAIQSARLLARYDYPLWAIEDNDWGHTTLARAQALDYPNLYREAPEKSPGWRTNERTRYVLWGELIEAVQQRLITIPNKAGLRQFYDVIRNPAKNGRIEALAGGHDDYPLAVGGTWQMRKHAGKARRRVQLVYS